MLGALVIRDVRRALGGGAWLHVLFFLLIATIVPFAVGPGAELLGRIASGAVWIAALTAALLPLERLVEPDRAEGVLDQLTVRGISGEEIALAKIVAHWLTFGPLLLIATFPAAALLGLGGEALGRTLLTLAIGTPALAALAVTVASLTAGLRGSSALGGLLLLPLAVPLLIFGAAAAGDAEAGALKLQAATALFILVGAPFVSGAALRALRT
jgi:heme exporter protein B